MSGGHGKWLLVALITLALVGCGTQGVRTTTGGTGTAITVGPLRFPIVARLDSSCAKKVQFFGPSMSGRVPDPSWAFTNFQESYDHDALMPVLFYVAIPPSAGATSTTVTVPDTSPVATTLPLLQRVWLVHLDKQHRVVMVIHIVHDAKHGWYVHELQQCVLRAPSGTTAGDVPTA